ncbi:ester cyclase [Humibacter ginsenosidimutans]|nr:ester cyclase [Humibacter ginsenosidimutans]
MDVTQLQQRVHEAWMRQRWDDWRRTCADEYRFDLTPTIRLDLEQTLAWSRAWFTAFPDYREEVKAVYTSDAGVAYELIGAGTSSADVRLFGRTVIPHVPGRSVEVRYAKVLVVNDAGKVIRDRQYLDATALRGGLETR